MQPFGRENNVPPPSQAVSPGWRSTSAVLEREPQCGWLRHWSSRPLWGSISVADLGTSVLLDMGPTKPLGHEDKTKTQAPR